MSYLGAPAAHTEGTACVFTFFKNILPFSQRFLTAPFISLSFYCPYHYSISFLLCANKFTLQSKTSNPWDPFSWKIRQQKSKLKLLTQEQSRKRSVTPDKTSTTGCCSDVNLKEKTLCRAYRTALSKSHASRGYSIHGLTSCTRRSPK